MSLISLSFSIRDLREEALIRKGELISKTTLKRQRLMERVRLLEGGLIGRRPCAYWKNRIITVVVSFIRVYICC